MNDDDFRQLKQLFTFHPPTDVQRASYEKIREAAFDLAHCICEECPRGPDRTAAIRHVREAVMNANASIATHNAAAYELS
jgi:hypothetical protein